MFDLYPVRLRASRHAALGDPVRLAIVDELASSDRSPVELRRRYGLESNLLAHHLDVLEEVGLITDLEPEELSASQWLKANRNGWGIENGSHQRLDVTLNDDRCRVRSGNGLLVLGLFRRLAVSLFMHWRMRQPKPGHKSLTDFQSLMGENNLAKAFSFITSKRPKLP